MKLPWWRQRKKEELETEIQSHLDLAMRDRMERSELLNARVKVFGANLAMWVWSRR